jgi:hypothetical protein
VQRLRAFTGPEAIDCGEPERGSATWITPAVVDGWLACAHNATVSGQAFRVIVGYNGVDWWTARGWVGSADGVLHQFAYTLALPGDRVTFEVRRCGAISKRSSGYTPFTCVPPRESELS